MVTLDYFSPLTEGPEVLSFYFQMNSHLQTALWIAHPVLQLAVIAAMLWRKQNRTFPFFFAYLVIEVLVFSIIFPIRQWGNYFAYFYAYWICEAVSLAVGFKVIHEIFLDIFRPYHTLKDLGSVMFKWAGLVLLMAAGVVAAASPASDQGPLVQAVLTLQRCVRVIQCGLILFLVVFSKYLGVSWRQRSFGIAMGIGGSAIVEQVGMALRASSFLSEPALNTLIMGAYNGAILLWLGYMWVSQAGRAAVQAPLASQRWDQSLTELQHPAGTDSLIPMFEGMVDRAFSNTGSASFEGKQEPREGTFLLPARPSESAPHIADRFYRDRLASKA
jgi:hypothetical protein